MCRIVRLTRLAIALLAVTALTATLLGACGGSGGGNATPVPTLDAGVTPAPMTLTSPDFIDGGELPEATTCYGASITPALRWSGAPPDTRSFVVTMELTGSLNGIYQWVVYNISANASSLDSGVGPDDHPHGASQGISSYSSGAAYQPPCQTAGTQATFLFRVYALNTPKISLAAGLRHGGNVIDAIAGHIIGQGELTATSTH